ncbi:MAG: Rid family hydrolase [Myxococcota bacterium]|nr:Rid family hydrolase [Myxococcota bacterium]
MSIDVVVPEANRKTYQTMQFAPAVRSGDFIFCSGCVGTGESVEEEFRSAWKQIEQILSEAGADLTDIVDTTIYLVDLQKNAEAMFKVKSEFIQEPYPASTWIGTTELVIPGARAEIKVIAQRPGISS